MELRRRVFLEFILPATMASDLASHARAALASSSVVRRGGLRCLEVDLKLTILLGCLEVTVLGRPPLLEEMLGVIAVVGVRGVQQ